MSLCAAGWAAICRPFGMRVHYPGGCRFFCFPFFIITYREKNCKPFCTRSPQAKQAQPPAPPTPLPARRRGRGAFAADRRSSRAGCVANRRRGAMQRFCSCPRTVSTRPLGNGKRCRGNRPALADQERKPSQECQAAFLQLTGNRPALAARDRETAAGGIVPPWLLGNGNRRRDSRQRFYICPEVQPGRLGKH